LTNFLTVKNPDAEADPNELEYRRKGKDMATQAQYDKLIEDNELAFFRADVCLGSPESYSLEEKAAICEDMESTNRAIEDSPSRSAAPLFWMHIAVWFSSSR